MATLLKLAVLAVAAFLLFGAYVGSQKTPEQRAQQEHARALAETCDQMMADAAPGHERRTTRQVCDTAKRQASR